ncbi:MAG TPA: peptidase inhibitor family I36 protein, partial [Jatrophihabitans sp.]|nr:peptidase inhibitor family I36 protein [Jatrophihabitans sp.]
GMKSKLLLLASIGALGCVTGAPAAASTPATVRPATANCTSGAFCAWTAPNYTGSEFVFFTCGTRTTTLTSTGSWIANEPAGDKVVFHFRNGTNRTYQTPARVASFDWSSVLSFQIVC